MITIDHQNSAWIDIVDILSSLPSTGFVKIIPNWSAITNTLSYNTQTWSTQHKHEAYNTQTMMYNAISTQRDASLGRFTHTFWVEPADFLPSYQAWQHSLQWLRGRAFFSWMLVGMFPQTKSKPWWFQIFFILIPRSNLTNSFQTGWNHQLENLRGFKKCSWEDAQVQWRIRKGTMMNQD